jgi:hypothetical protein
MRNIILVAALSSAFMGATIKASHAADNPCKALAGTACDAIQGCKWFPGEVQTHKVADIEIKKERKPRCSLRLNKTTLVKTEPYAAK